MPTFDVIVIGGGHNGLTTAGCLAGNGRKVLLLEAGDALGGLAAGDEFHPGFTSIGMLHDTSGVRPQLIDALQLDRHGLTLTDPPPVFAPQEPGGGRGLLLHRDPAKAATEIAPHSATDARRYDEYRAFVDRIAPVVAPLLDRAPPTVAGSVGSMLSLMGRGLSLRRLGRADMMELLRIAPMCVADWMNEWFETELLSCVLASPALTCTRMGPWSPGSAANLLRLETMAGRAVEGGPAALIEALAAAARERGVEIRLETEVQRIACGNGAVQGVTCTSGEEIDAPVVASSCDPKRTLLQLLGAGAITPHLYHQVDKLRTAGTTAKVDLALSGPLRFACRPDLEVEHARVGETLDGMERAFDASKYGRFSTDPILDICVPSISNPSLAQGDGCVVSILAHFAPRELKSSWTDQSRRQLGDAVVQTLRRFSPDLDERIIARRVLTPEDIERRYRVTGGHIHHIEHALDQMIVRPVPQCARHATPIRGLYLCGSGTHPGGGLTGGPGLLAAAAVRQGPE